MVHLSNSARQEGPQRELVPKTHSVPPPDSDNPFDTPFDGQDEDEALPGKAEDDFTTITKDRSNVSRMTQWPSFSNIAAPSPPLPHKPQLRSQKSIKRSSVHKPIRERSRHRQKKQNERAGIRLNTNVSRHRGAAPIVPQPAINKVGPQLPAESGRFVDLAALQALESQTIPNNGGFWKGFLGHAPNPSAAVQQTFNVQSNPHDVTAARIDLIPGFESSRANGLKPPALTMEEDLSPNDRPIVIGISIPSATIANHVTSPQTAGSDTSNIINCYEAQTPKDNPPETPVIVITPAEVSYWSPISADTVTPQSRRVPSSVYSRPASYAHATNQPSEIPPMPQIDYSVLKGQMSGRESVGTVFAEDEDDDEIPSAHPRRLKIRTGTIPEEDERQILTRKERSGSDGSERKRKSMLSPNENRTSVGWWNTIVSPFMTRSNTVLFPQTQRQEERPPVPNITSPDSKSNKDGNLRFWEKPLSPKSPLSSTTISSDEWWENRNTIDGTAKWKDFDFKSMNEIQSHKPEELYSTLRLGISTGTLLDAASATGQQPSVKGNRNSGTHGLQRNQSLGVRSDRSSAISPADREAPFMLDDPSITSVNTGRLIESMHTGNQQNLPPSLRLASSTIDNTSSIMPQQTQTRFPSENTTQIRTPLAPPPYSPPRRAFPKYAAVYPPGHNSSTEQPQSPGPLSPGLQQAMSSSGAIALTDVPLTPTPRRLINLNSGYPTLPLPAATRQLNPVDFEIASEKARKIDAKRRRHEKEEAIAHKAGGLWRGRGCVSNRGCYGRTGPEGRKRRRCWLGVVGVLFGLTILVVVLATQLHRTTKAVDAPTQWVNLTVFPPIYTGVSMVSSSTNVVANTGCVYPKTVWSCALPKELQMSVSQNTPDQPSLKLFIQWDNSSAANATWGGPTEISPRRISAGNAVNAGQLLKRLAIIARQAITFVPSPTPPTIAEQVFLGNTTDGIVSDNKSGERTPFYITFIDPVAATTASTKLLKRQQNETTGFPDIGKSIPLPELDADGTAAAANLLPLPKQQPLRLFDRGLPTEHYGFYSYFNRSIFLKSTALLNATNAGDGEVPADLNGGCTKAEARFRCTWSQTRFLVQLWTRKDAGAVLLNSTTSSSISSVTGVEGAANYSFPYPVTITTDRHGGDPIKKGLFCYEIDEREKIIPGSGKVRPEFRAFGGKLINQAPNAFDTTDSDPNLGGFDGGDSGCGCQWANWHSVS